MTELYKLTDENSQTRKKTQWGVGTEHTAPGGGELCTKAWLHAYRHPLMAVFMNPIYADFLNPKLYLAEGDVGKDDGTKVGCTRLQTIREIPLPKMTTEQRVTAAIKCVMTVYKEPSWVMWAENWMSGKDRTEGAAKAAEAAAKAAWAAGAAEAAEAAWAAAGAAGAAGWAAGWAAKAAEAEGWAAWAAARAAEAEGWAAWAAARAAAWAAEAAWPASATFSSLLIAVLEEVVPEASNG